MNLKLAGIALGIVVIFWVLLIAFAGNSRQSADQSVRELDVSALPSASAPSASAVTETPTSRVVVSGTDAKSSAPEERFDPCAGIPAVLEAYLEKLATSPDALAAARRSAKRLLELTPEQERAYHLSNATTMLKNAPESVQERFMYFNESKGLYLGFWLPCGVQRGERDQLRSILLKHLGTAAKDGNRDLWRVIANLLAQAHLCEPQVTETFKEAFVSGTAPDSDLAADVLLDAMRWCDPKPFANALELACSRQLSVKGLVQMLGNLSGSRLITLEQFVNEAEVVFAATPVSAPDGWELYHSILNGLGWLGMAEKDERVLARAVQAIPADAYATDNGMVRDQLYKALIELGNPGATRLKELAQEQPANRDTIIQVLLDRRHITLDEAEEMRHKK